MVSFSFQNKTFKFLSLLAVLFLFIILGRYFNFDPEYYRNALSKFPVVLSGLIFVFLYVLTTTFIWMGPKDAFRVAGAVLFGPYISTVFVWIGEILNAAILFFLSRNLGQEFVQEKFKIKTGNIDKVKKESSALSVLALRLNPLVPFRFLDLGYGLSRVSFRKYFIVIVIASLPRIFWLQYILSGVGMNVFKDIPAVMDYFGKNFFLIKYSGLYFLGVAILSLAAVIVKKVKK